MCSWLFIFVRLEIAGSKRKTFAMLLQVRSILEPTSVATISQIKLGRSTNFLRAGKCLGQLQKLFDAKQILQTLH
jgi:hypothetical protein